MSEYSDNVCTSQDLHKLIHRFQGRQNGQNLHQIRGLLNDKRWIVDTPWEESFSAPKWKQLCVANYKVMYLWRKLGCMIFLTFLLKSPKRFIFLCSNIELDLKLSHGLNNCSWCVFLLSTMHPLFCREIAESVCGFCQGA